MDSSQGESQAGRKPDAAQIRVLIVEDHAVVAQALSAMLEADAGIKVVGRFGSVAGAIEGARRAAPDVVLLDYRLPDGTGAEATAAIRRQVDPPAILLLSAENTEEARRRCFESGACDFLLKSADVAEIPRAIRQAAFGKVPLPRLVPALR